jgi:hypothetical protein
MKKFDKKFVASALLAGIVAASMTVSASAAGYWVPPVYPPVDDTTTPDDNTGKEEDKGDEKDKNESVPESIVSDSDIEAAIASGEDLEVEVDDNGNAIVKESAIGEIAKQDEPFTFDVVDENSDTDYTVTIDPAEIDITKDINLAMNIQILDSDEDVSDIDVPAGSIVIAPAMKGDFGMTLIITIPADALKDIDVASAELYYISDDGDVSLVPNGLALNADGSVSIAISHASEYVISDVDLTAEGGDDTDDDDGDDDDDDNGAIIEDDDDTAPTGKDDTSVVVNGDGTDTNPVTGTTLALGSLAVFAAAAIATSKKRK